MSEDAHKLFPWRDGDNKDVVTVYSVEGHHQGILPDQAKTQAAPPKPTHPLPSFSSIESAPKTTKGWGDEVCIVNLDYCGKLLRFKKGAKLSMHAHAQKAESFLISSGRIQFNYIDTKNASIHARVVEEGDIIHIPRMLPHQIEALEDTVVTEFSTHHEDADSFRYFPGNSQVMSQSGWKS